MNKTKKISLIILAAGQSSRMKSIKPILKIGEKASILWIIDTFRTAGIDDINVVTGYHSDEIESVIKSHNVKIIKNNCPQYGMFSSVKKGLEALGSDKIGFFIIPADMPMVKVQTINKIIEKIDINEMQLIMPSFLNKNGHPLFVSSHFFDEILSMDLESNLRDLLSKYSDFKYIVPCADNGIVMDMDFPKDYEAMVKYYESREFPDLDECQAMMSIMNLPEKVINHSKKVAELSLLISHRLITDANLPLSIKKMQAAALLHDIAKGKDNHPEVGANYVFSEGFQELKQPIEVHMKYPYEIEQMSLTESEILYLCDKLIDEDKVSTLEERFEKMKLKYPEVDENIIYKRIHTASFIKEKIEKTLNIDNLYEILI